MNIETGTGLKEARTAAGMSQAALAKAAGCVSATEISKAERGIKELTPEQLEAVTKVLEEASGALSAASAEPSVELTDEEQELLDLYRAADADTRQMAIFVLKGMKGSPGLEKMIAGMLKGTDPDELIAAAKNILLGANVGDLISLGKKLMNSKSIGGLMSSFAGTPAGGSVSGPAPAIGSEGSPVAVCGEIGKDTTKSFMTFTYLYSVSIYVLLLSFYFWLWRTDIKPEK